MEKKIPLKTIYLLLVISIGLVGLGIGSTFAMFTASASINNPISLSTNLNYGDEVIETIEVDIDGNSDKTVTLNINNSTSNTLNYTCFYISDSPNIELGTNLAYNTVGTINASNNISLDVTIRNNSSSSEKVILGVMSSKDSIVLSNDMHIIPNSRVYSINPLSDYRYVLGSDTTRITSLLYDSGNELTLTNPITINSNEILLIKYIGTNDTVYVPDTYTVNGTEYNVVLLSVSIYEEYNLNDRVGVFRGNTSVKNVAIDNDTKIISHVIDSQTDRDAYSMFSGCTSLTNAILPDNLVSVSETFRGCTSLVNAPVIPGSVTNMSYSFFDCTSLATAPVIPSSVTDMRYTFRGCTSLVNAPVIPDGVTDMSATFYLCSSLETAPAIPDSVTKMFLTFSNCTNLAGNVIINSPVVTDSRNTFAYTSKPITVKVPSSSTTYTTLSGSSLPSNVTLTGVQTAVSTISSLFSRTKYVTSNGVSHEVDATHQLIKDRSGNIRYYGQTPNNYIYFNCSNYSDTSSCEIWRIIGVIDGRLKLIRTSSIGSFSWDTSASNVNSGFGINEWSQADLMKLLNPGYSGVGGSLYYNSSSGTCYSNNNPTNEVVSCDFTFSGIKNDETRNMISVSNYYLGGNSSTQIYPDTMLSSERETTVISNPLDGVIRTTIWSGRIALPYPSDYGYATDLSQCTQNLYNYDNAGTNNTYPCRGNNWMWYLMTEAVSATSNGSHPAWLLSPNSSDSSRIFRVCTEGFLLNTAYAQNAISIYPTLYLKSNLSISAGTGTSSNPYVLY